jgi:hypothetical protein
MFGPKVPKAQTKALENSSSKMPQRSTLLGHRLGHDPVELPLFLQRTIGNQATLRLLAQQTPRPAVRDPRGDSQQEVGATENTMTGEASRGASGRLVCCSGKACRRMRPTGFQQDPAISA